MTKEDYMRLPKERLAELLAERDEQDSIKRDFLHQPVWAPNQPPCYAPDGTCVNPFHDCINCPKMFHGGGTITTTTFNRKSQDND